MKKVLPFICVIIALVVCLPLFRPGFFVSDDGSWMIIRLSAFYQTFREGQFPVRFLGRLNFGYGYPVANFLYPGFMYIGSIIHALGVPFIDTIKLILGGSIVVATLFTYFWLTTYFTPIASAVGAIGFVTAPYIAFDLYKRGSVGEVLACAFAAIGLYSIAAKKKWLFGIVIPLLILSHNTLAALFIAIFVMYITVRRMWREFGGMLLVGILMASFFWMPAIYERKYVIFDSVLVANPMAYFATGPTLYLIGFAGIIALFVVILSRRTIKERGLFIGLTMATVLLATPMSTPLWNIPALIHLVQFPYRFLSVAAFSSAWLMAYVVSTQKQKLLWIAVFVGIGIFSIVRVLPNVEQIAYPEGYYTTNEATTNVSDEYMPKWVGVKPTTHAPSRIQFYKGKGKIEEKRMTTQEIDIVVDAAEESVIQVNTLYYPGWGAMIDNERVKISYDNPQSVMRLDIPSGKHHVVVAFRETISRFIADSISFVALVFYIILLCI